jgi:hypothetical protein
MRSAGTIKIERKAWSEQDRMIVVIADPEGEKDSLPEPIAKTEHANQLSGGYFLRNDRSGNCRNGAGFGRRTSIRKDFAYQRKFWPDEILARQSKVEKVL